MATRKKRRPLDVEQHVYAIAEAVRTAGFGRWSQRWQRRRGPLCLLLIVLLKRP